MRLLYLQEQATTNHQMYFFRQIHQKEEIETLWMSWSDMPVEEVAHCLLVDASIEQRLQGIKALVNKDVMLEF